MPAQEGDIRPVPNPPVVAGREESAVIEGVTKTQGQTTATTSDDSYKTEFVKVYQDAGVIGASMLTLLVLCFLLGMFCLRLLKMYVSLTESRDKLDAARTEFSAKIVERILVLENKVKEVLHVLQGENLAKNGKLDTIIDNQRRAEDRMERMQDRNDRTDRRHREERNVRSGHDKDTPPAGGV